MYKSLDFHIKGASPLIMHNARKLTNPMHPLTKQIKVFSGKKNKTEEDFYVMSKLEWLGGMYLTEEATVILEGNTVKFIGGGVPCIPGEAIMATLVNGAKKNKLGTQLKSALLVLSESPLIYDGVKVPEDMWEAGIFTDIRTVKIQRSAIMRSRPIFCNWELKFTVEYLPSVLNVDQIEESARVAGQIVGICDHRPVYGRFNLN